MYGCGTLPPPPAPTPPVPAPTVPPPLPPHSLSRIAAHPRKHLSPKEGSPSTSLPAPCPRHCIPPVTHPSPTLAPRASSQPQPGSVTPHLHPLSHPQPACQTPSCPPPAANSHPLPASPPHHPTITPALFPSLRPRLPLASPPRSVSVNDACTPRSFYSADDSQTIMKRGLVGLFGSWILGCTTLWIQDHQTGHCKTYTPRACPVFESRHRPPPTSPPHNTYTHMCPHTHTHTHTHVSAHAHTHTHTRVCVCPHTHTRTRAHTCPLCCIVPGTQHSSAPDQAPMPW